MPNNTALDTAQLIATLLGGNINQALTPGYNGQPNPMSGGMPQTTATPTLSGNTALLAQALGIDPNLLNQSAQPQQKPSSGGIGGILKSILPLIATAGAGALAGGKNNRMLGAASAMGGFQQNEQLKQQQALQERQMKEQETNSALGRLIQMRQLEQQQQQAKAQSDEKSRAARTAALKELRDIATSTDFTDEASKNAYYEAVRGKMDDLGIEDERDAVSFGGQALAFAQMKKKQDVPYQYTPEGTKAVLSQEEEKLKLQGQYKPPTKTTDQSNYEYAQKDPQFAAFLKESKQALDKANVVAVETVDENGNPITRFVSKTAGATYPKPPKQAAEKPPTAAERSSYKFWERGRDAENVLANYESLIMKYGFMDQVRLNNAPNFAQSEEMQVYNQAQRQFTEARLRKDSGAAIPESEFESDRKMYFVQPGDTPEVIKRKKDAREATLNALARESGKAYTESYGAEPPPPPNAPNATVDPLGIRGLMK